MTVDLDKMYVPVNLMLEGAAAAVANLAGPSSETNDHDDATITGQHHIKLFDSLWQMTAKSSNGALYGYLPKEEWKLLQKIKDYTADILYSSHHGMPLAVRGKSVDLDSMKVKEKQNKEMGAKALKEREEKRVKLQNEIVQMQQKLRGNGKHKPHFFYSTKCTNPHFTSW